MCSKLAQSSIKAMF
ncbi:hypothetical protein ABMN46_001995 [Escherichia coli]